jgi:isopentenyldiphosphate isomerase
MRQPAFAQDPDELFDVVDVRGNPTGEVKRRADVHRDGDWHRAIHIWIVSDIGGVGSILMQRRSLAKDTWPGALDVTVGGHLGAGEDLGDAYREIEEEIGIAIDPADLRFIGRRIAVNDANDRYIDRELQDTFIVRDDRRLTAYAPNPHELSGLVRIPLDPLLDLLAYDIDVIEAEEWTLEGDVVRAVLLGREDFHETPDNYLYRLAIAAANHLRGDRHVAI